MTEQELTNTVLKMAAEHNVLAHHCNDSRYCSGDNGLPDLILVGSKHTMFVELKNFGELRKNQRLWRERLLATGAEYEIWTPYELKSGRVAEILAWL